MKIKFQKLDSHNPVLDPPNFFGMNGERERQRVIEYLEGVVEELKKGKLYISVEGTGQYPDSITVM